MQIRAIGCTDCKSALSGAIHSTRLDNNGNKVHVLEKNVVVLTNQTSSTFSDRKNENIISDNNYKIATVKEQLNSNYSNAKNTNGESVEFKFNVTGLEIKNTDGPAEKNEFKILANKSGLVSSEFSYVGSDGKDVFNVSPAAIITTDNPGSNNGGATDWGCKISLDGTFDSLSHEIGHTLETRDQRSAHEDGGVLGHPQGHVNEKEVDKMLEDSYEK